MVPLLPFLFFRLYKVHPLSTCAKRIQTPARNSAFSFCFFVSLRSSFFFMHRDAFSTFILLALTAAIEGFCFSSFCFCAREVRRKSVVNSLRFSLLGTTRGSFPVFLVRSVKEERDSIPEIASPCHEDVDEQLGPKTSRKL